MEARPAIPALPGVYNSGTSITLTAPAISGANAFGSWTGCTSVSGTVCTVLISANTTVSGKLPCTLELYSDRQFHRSRHWRHDWSIASRYKQQLWWCDQLHQNLQFRSECHPYCSNNRGNRHILILEWLYFSKHDHMPGSEPDREHDSHRKLSDERCLTSIVVSPNPASVAIGETLQFSASVKGNGSFGSGVTWSVSGPTGYTGSVGSITATGLYTTPYPAPASVTITAMSTSTSTVAGSVTLTLTSPADNNRSRTYGRCWKSDSPH